MLSFFSLVTRSGTFWSEYPHHCYSSASDCPLRQRFKIMSIIGHLNQTSDKLFEWKFHFSTKSASSFVAKRNISVLMSQRRKAKRFLTCRNNCKKTSFSAFSYSLYLLNFVCRHFFVLQSYNRLGNWKRIFYRLIMNEQQMFSCEFHSKISFFLFEFL